MGLKLNPISGFFDLTGSSSGGSGDVTGPASSTDNAAARFDGTGGKTLQNSTFNIADTGAVTITTVGTSSYTQLIKINNDTGTTPMINWVKDTTAANRGLQFSADGGIVAGITNTGEMSAATFNPGGSPGEARLAINVLTLQKTASTPMTPTANFQSIYFKTDQNLYMVDSDGLETQVNGGAGGATTALDNLASTAINADLDPTTDASIDIGGPELSFATIRAYVFKNGTAGNDLNVTTQNTTGSTISGQLLLTSGNTSGSGDTGSVLIGPGISSGGGTRGNTSIDGLQVRFGEPGFENIFFQKDYLENYYFSDTGPFIVVDSAIPNNNNNFGIVTTDVTGASDASHSITTITGQNTDAATDSGFRTGGIYWQTGAVTGGDGRSGEYFWDSGPTEDGDSGGFHFTSGVPTGSGNKGTFNVDARYIDVTSSPIINLSKVKTAGSIPAIAADAGAGGGATASILTGSTDLAGRVSITTGTLTLATGSQVTITFAEAFDTGTFVNITPVNATAAIAESTLGVYVPSGATTFSIAVGIAASPTTTYTWNYSVVGY